MFGVNSACENCNTRFDVDFSEAWNFDTILNMFTYLWKLSMHSLDFLIAERAKEILSRLYGSQIAFDLIRLRE